MGTGFTPNTTFLMPGTCQAPPLCGTTLSMRTIMFPGSTPLLSSAEAVAAFPQAKWHAVGPVLLADELPERVLHRLTGCTKTATEIFHIPLRDLRPQLLVDWIKLHERGTSKLIFSVTWHGSSNLQRRFPIELKQALRAQLDRSVRWFESDEGVSPAAIAKLGLIDEGYDFTIIEERDTVHIAVTREVQDADRWTEIDMERPRRNAKNGMTPPKLAAMMVHLAGNPTSVLDPFCGSGTFLMSAAMAGAEYVAGSDILPLIIKDTDTNIRWAIDRGLIPASARIESAVADATKPLPFAEQSFDAIVTEGFLGTPLHGDEESFELEREAQAVHDLWRDSLPHLARVLKSDGVIIGMLPSYRTKHGEARVRITPSELAQAGLHQEAFALADGSTRDELLYLRPNQFVGRNIVRWKKHS